MAGGNLSPRQQMIGLMYLVLLAMLAMNASKDLLNAFVMLEKGINKTVDNFAIKNNGLYGEIEAAASKGIGQKKAELARQIKAKADTAVNIINRHSEFLMQKTGGRDESPDSIPYGRDNQDEGAAFYCPGGVPSKDAEYLKAAVDSFTAIIKKADEYLILNDGIKGNDDPAILAATLGKWDTLFFTGVGPDPGDPEVSVTWAQKISEHLPLAAVTANLALYKSYIRNAESDIVSKMVGDLEGPGFTVNRADGFAAFENGYVLKGDSVKADVFISAYNSSIPIKVYTGVPDTSKFENGKYTDPASTGKPPIIGDYKELPVSGGKGKFQFPTTEAGAQTLQGVVGMTTLTGTDYYLFNKSYMVAEPTATIAATKMNVIYVGVNNPIAISAPGVSLDEIEVKGAGISFRPDKKKGTYIARASKPNGRGTEISVVKKDGTKLGGMKFRIKRLPDPAASVLNQKEGLVSKGKLKAATFIKAEMENFDFDVKVKVQQFKMTVSIGGDLKEFNAKGNKLTGPMRKMLSQVRRGNRVYFEAIKVKMPDGSVRKVPSIILKVK